MNCCVLEDISAVGELTELRMLSLYTSRIQRLPEQIGRLHQLLFLDLGDAYIEVIPPNVLSKLTSLKELYMTNSFCNWAVKGLKIEDSNASLNELRKLDHLTRLHDLYVPDARAWPVDLFFEKLESYTIFIGDTWKRTRDGDHLLKTMKVKLDKRFAWKDGIKMMLKNVDVLHLDELIGVQNVLSDLNSNGFPNLKSLVIQENAEIRCIAMCSNYHVLYAFPKLESLSLYNLMNLEHICHGPLTDKSFIKLGVIKVQNCNKVTCLFSNSMIKGFPHLVEIEVSQCRLLEAIVLVEGVKNPYIEFPKLRYLTLRGLPDLISFCYNKTTEIGKGKKQSSFTTPLFHDKVSCPNLEKLMISEASKLTTIWDHQKVVPNSFWKLKNVDITDCEKLVTIFPASLSRNLYDLKTLAVRYCSSVERIFEVMKLDQRQPGLRRRIQLICIDLFQLPKLRHVCVVVPEINFNSTQD